MDRPRNVALIVLDSLRWDHVTPCMPACGLTPTLARAAAAGAVYRRCYTTSAASPGSHDALFTGRAPWTFEQTRHTKRFRPPEPPLPELATEAGYSTIGLSANPYISRRVGYDRGFELFDDGMPENTSGRLSGATNRLRVHARRALFGDSGSVRQLRILRRAKRAGALDRPFFLFMNLMDAHLPYRPPLRYLPLTHRRPHWYPFGPLLSTERINTGVQRMLPSTWRDLRRFYAASVRWLDRVVLEVLETLADTSTHVFLLADHGEALGEGGAWGHNLNLAEHTIRVPLVSYGPGASPGVHQNVVSILGVSEAVRANLGVGPSQNGSDPGQNPGNGIALAERPAPRSGTRSRGPDDGTKPGPYDARLVAAVSTGRKLVRTDVTCESASWLLEEGSLHEQSTHRTEADAALAAALDGMDGVRPAPTVKPWADEDPVLLARLKSLGYVE